MSDLRKQRIQITTMPEQSTEAKKVSIEETSQSTSRAASVRRVTSRQISRREPFRFIRDSGQGHSETRGCV